MWTSKSYFRKLGISKDLRIVTWEVTCKLLKLLWDKSTSCSSTSLQLAGSALVSRALVCLSFTQPHETLHTPALTLELARRQYTIIETGCFVFCLTFSELKQTWTVTVVLLPEDEIELVFNWKHTCKSVILLNLSNPYEHVHRH